MAAAVLIQNLKKRYGDVEAVKDISFTVEPGELFGLLGPNGAGKTTVIRCLCTLSKPDAGKIEVSGVSVIDNPRAARRRHGPCRPSGRRSSRGYAAAAQACWLPPATARTVS